MSKFKVGDNVVITSRRNNGAKGIITEIANVDPYDYDNSYYVDIYEGARGEFVCEHDLRLAERLERDIFVESLYNYQNNSYNDDYLTEMASIAYYKGLNIAYNDEDRLGVAYFKVYDHDKIRSAEKVARLHFKDSGMEYHKDPLGKQPWILNSSDIKKIKNLLKGANKTNPDYTNWQTLCFQWNYDNKLIPMKATIKDYFAGNYDNQHFNDSRLESAYVPSTQEMPDTWIYDPSKGKR